MDRISFDDTYRPLRFIAAYWARYAMALLLLFALHRLTFLLFYFSQTFGADWQSSLASFWFALKLDIATLAYLFSVPLLVAVLLPGKARRFAVAVLRIWFGLLFVAFTLACAGDVVVYKEWGTKLHYNALLHLSHPSEVLHTGTGSHFTAFAIVLLVLLPLAFPADRWVHAPLKKIQPSGAIVYLPLSVSILFMGALAFVAGRGGFDPIPINTSQSYFSTRQILNDAAVNSPWTITESILENQKTLHGNPYTFYGTEDLPRLAAPLLDGNAPQKGGLLQTARPNIILFVLESWSANAVSYTQNGQSPLPYFNTLISEGWYWDKAYSVGWKSDFGVPGVLSAWPCYEHSSVSMHPAKCGKLPGLARSLDRVGYTSDFLFGGQLIYGNLKSYVYQTGFGRVREQEHLPGGMAEGRLGVHDDDLLQYAAKELHGEKDRPFFSAVYTLSTHPPFDYPGNSHIFSGAEADYLNSLRYADDAIRHFIQTVSHEPWFNNTLFVFTADHGRSVPGCEGMHEPCFYRIPVLFWGPALQPGFRGKTYAHTCSQTDVVPTLLQEMNLPTDDYPFGRNVFHPQKQHLAYSTFCGGFHVNSDEGSCSYDLHRNRPKENGLDSLTEERLGTAGKAYLQYLMDCFLAL